jgi:hypothetical protein
MFKIPIKDLHYDLDNPRLPEELMGANTSALAEYYYEHATVQELVDSMLQNGFFPHEPVIVTPAAEGYTVVEGNRRLTALYIIHNLAIVKKLPRPDGTVSKEQIARLDSIPCVISENESETRRFIGFRHISGPKTWDPEAKARFLAEEVATALENGEAHPFRYVANSVGTNVQSVRDSYVALKLLQHGRSEAGINITQVQRKRFGVWLRLMSSPEFREFIGFAQSPDLNEVIQSIQSVNLENLAEVVSDLSSSSGEPAILKDSRDATDYGRVLCSATARTTLRKTRDLEAAITIVTKESLSDRIRKESRRVDALCDELRASEYNPEVEDASKVLASSARTLLKLAKPDEDDDLFV